MSSPDDKPEPPPTEFVPLIIAPKKPAPNLAPPPSRPKSALTPVATASSPRDLEPRDFPSPASPGEVPRRPPAAAERSSEQPFRQFRTGPQTSQIRQIRQQSRLWDLAALLILGAGVALSGLILAWP